MSTIAALVATPLLAVIAIDDLRHRRIRNRNVLGLAAVAAAAVVVAAAAGDGAAAGRAALGAVLGCAPLATVWVLQPGRVGGGDVKLGAAVGALIGGARPWLAVAVVGLGLAGSLVIAFAWRELRVAVAPAMTAATVVVAAVAAVS